MKPITLLSWLVFLGFATWVLTWSPSFVRDARKVYFSAMKPFLINGSQLKTSIKTFEDEVEHSQTLERRIAEVETILGTVDLLSERLQELEKENATLREALSFQQQAPFEILAAKVLPNQNERLQNTFSFRVVSQTSRSMRICQFCRLKA